MKTTMEEDGKPCSLKRFVELKPQLAEGILGKLEGVV